MAEDKARNRVPSCDSARARNAVFRPQGPAVARMDFFNGLLYHLAEQESKPHEVRESDVAVVVQIEPGIGGAEGAGE